MIARHLRYPSGPFPHEGREFVALELEWQPNSSLRTSGVLDKMAEARSKIHKITIAWHNASVMLAHSANFEIVNKAFEEMHKKEIGFWAEVLAGMALRYLRIRENSNLWMACEFQATHTPTQSEPDGESIGECDSEMSSDEEEDDGNSLESFLSHSSEGSEEDGESNDDDESYDESDDESDDDDDTAPAAAEEARAEKRGLEDADDANSIKEQQTIKRMCNR